MRAVLPLLLVVVALGACAPGPVDPARAADRCEERARAAQGPTGSVTVGVNTHRGAFAGGEIGVSGDYLAGRDPLAVYEDCVYALTGAAPIRPARLR
ncbi:MAG: hypothetical protein IT542_13065 [Rubellimicrobium sp.]|nr:hypothetical protein [Rubellimicrobium sp.]